MKQETYDDINAKAYQEFYHFWNWFFEHKPKVAEKLLKEYTQSLKK